MAEPGLFQLRPIGFPGTELPPLWRAAGGSVRSGVDEPPGSSASVNLSTGGARPRRSSPQGGRRRKHDLGQVKVWTRLHRARWSSHGATVLASPANKIARRSRRWISVSVCHRRQMSTLQHRETTTHAKKRAYGRAVVGPSKRRSTRPSRTLAGASPSGHRRRT